MHEQPADGECAWSILMILNEMCLADLLWSGALIAELRRVVQDEDRPAGNTHPSISRSIQTSMSAVSEGSDRGKQRSHSLSRLTSTEFRPYRNNCGLLKVDEQHFFLAA